MQDKNSIEELVAANSAEVIPQARSEVLAVRWGREIRSTGDRNADVLALMSEEHGTAIYGYCARVLADRALADDVHQQVFEEAFRGLDELQHVDRARAWLFGIATHRCVDALRNRQRIEKRVADVPDRLCGIPDDRPDPGELLDAARIARVLDGCLRLLSPESRMAVILRFQEGMTYEEMGRLCRENAATLQARVARALPKLRRCAERNGVER